MSTAKPEIDIDTTYKFGWHDPANYVFEPKKGLNADIVREISAIKNEPEWMTKFRLRSLEIFESREIPDWGGDLGELDFQDIYYYIKAADRQGRSWDEVPDDIRNTFDRLGIPEAEQKFLAGVSAQYESEVVYHSIREDLEQKGVIFCDTDTALREHEEIFREHWATVIPPGDNTFSALNSAVWSGGSFIWVPPGVEVEIRREPMGVVGLITPWNFPINQAVRKISAALATGCSVILKAPEETPASPAELVRCFADAGVPAGVVNLVYGSPADISNYLIPHPVIRKMTFTGSTPVGKQLAAIAGAHMKRATMELGGHAPVIVFDDADIDAVAKTMTFMKYRNAGQVCVSPTRFLVQEGIYKKFVEKFVEGAKAVKVGDGFDPATKMATLASDQSTALPARRTTPAASRFTVSTAPSTPTRFATCSA